MIYTCMYVHTSNAKLLPHWIWVSGPLKLPKTDPANFPDAYKAKLSTGPRFNAEEVIDNLV